MDNLFLLLFLVSLIALIVGLIKPTLFSRFIKGDLTRKKIGLIFGIATFVFFVLFGVTIDSSKTEKATTNNQQSEQVAEQKNENQQQTPTTEQPVKEEKNLKYQIIYELANERYDGGKNYYVLIDPVDLSSDSFKTDIKVMAKKIVAEKGKKISIELHDSRESLNISYKQYGDQSLGRPTTVEENKIKEKHFIAAYAGELETGIYPNSLMFFPGAFKDSPEVGKYVETIEFDASK